VSPHVKFVGEAKKKKIKKNKKKKEKDLGMRGSRERVIHDEIVAMPEPREFPSVDEMEEHKESEDSQEGEEDVEEDDSETITTAEQLREVSNEPETF